MPWILRHCHLFLSRAACSRTPPRHATTPYQTFWISVLCFSVFFWCSFDILHFEWSRRHTDAISVSQMVMAWAHHVLISNELYLFEPKHLMHSTSAIIDDYFIIIYRRREGDDEFHFEFLFCHRLSVCQSRSCHANGLGLNVRSGSSGRFQREWRCVVDHTYKPFASLHPSTAIFQIIDLYVIA